MELSEARKILEELKPSLAWVEDVEAISTILQELDNLQKENEQLRKISKMIESYPIDSSDNTFILIEKREFFNNPYFKNLLDDYISKDKIKAKIDEIQSTIQVYGGFTAGKMVEYYRKLGKLEALKDLLEE